MMSLQERTWLHVFFLKSQVDRKYPTTQNNYFKVCCLHCTYEIVLLFFIQKTACHAITTSMMGCKRSGLNFVVGLALTCVFQSLSPNDGTVLGSRTFVQDGATVAATAFCLLYFSDSAHVASLSMAADLTDEVFVDIKGFSSSEEGGAGTQE
jgi:hypothetical protein